MTLQPHNSLLYFHLPLAVWATRHLHSNALRRTDEAMAEAAKAASWACNLLLRMLVNVRMAKAVAGKTRELVVRDEWGKVSWPWRGKREQETTGKLHTSY
jgi:urocanate hydratase